MRSLVCVLLLICPLMGQSLSREAPGDSGTFFVDGVLYKYATGTNYTVVAAVHSALNHKFLAVKVRIYNSGQRSITVQPGDVTVEDMVRGREVTAVSATELARRLRRPYNMARYAVGNGGDDGDQQAIASMIDPQLMALMRTMASRATADRPALAQNNVLYTDTPGAIDEGDGRSMSATCDKECRLRNYEASGKNALSKLQRQASPESVEEYALLANTVPPRANVGGVLYYPLGKLAEAAGVSEHAKKGRLVRVTVAVMGENYQFQMPVE